MKTIFILFFIALTMICKPQNLVSNPNFEIYSNCPNSASQIDSAIGWNSFREHPDYFNSCSILCIPYCVGVPYNIAGTQEAIGNGYAGFTTYNDGDSQFREILGTKLIDSLSPGVKYFVTAYISRAYVYAISLRGASNNIGFRFSNEIYSQQNPIPIDNFTHINENNIIMDTTNWTKIGGSFIADTSYKYLAIGNFYDSLHTLFYPTNGLGISYYYIDYVCVSTDSMECATNYVGISEMNSHTINIYPNPVSDFLIIEKVIPGIVIKIFDLMGKCVLEKLSDGSIEQISLSGLSSGIYFINANCLNRKFIKN